MESRKVKKFSIGMMLVTFVLMLSMVFLFPTRVFAETALNSTSDTLTLDYSDADYNIKNDDQNGLYIILPTPSAVDDDNETEVVEGIVATTVSLGQVKAKVVKFDDNGADKYKMYLVANCGNYSVVYTKTNEYDVSVTERIEVKLNRDIAEFTWESNSEQIIPSKVNANAGNKIVFPYPFVKVGENSETAINVADTTQKPKDIANLTIRLIGPDAQDVEISKNETTGYYEWTVPQNASQGKYTVKYAYKNDNMDRAIFKEFNFIVTTSDVETELKIDEFSSSLPSSMALFEETEFPKPIVVNTKDSNASVDVYTKIYLTFTPDLSEDTATVYTNDFSKKDAQGYTYTASLDNFKFTPTAPGKYTAKYVVTDFFGKTAEQTSSLNAITSSKTAESGAGFIVEPYTSFDEFEVDEKTMTLKDKNTAEWMIPTKVQQATVTGDGDNITTEDIWNLPAIFGYDKYTTDSSKLTYERIIRYTNSSNTTVKLTFNSSESGDALKANKIYTTSGTYKVDANAVIPFAFTEITDYTVEYIVKDAFNKILFNKTYTVNVLETYTDETAPVVKFEGLDSTSVQKGAVFKFKVNATDDSRLNIVVTAQVGTAEAVQLFADSEGYYTFDTKDIETTTNVTFAATATDVFGNPGTKSKTITVNVITNEDIPTIDFDFSDYTVDTEDNKLKDVYIGEDFTLPFVTFDCDDDYTVEVTIKKGSNIVNNPKTYSANGLFELEGEVFTPSSAGDYVVTYTAETSVVKNKAIKSFVFTAKVIERATINLGSFESSYEYGDEIDLRNLTVLLTTGTGTEDVTGDYDFDTGYNGNGEDIQTYVTDNNLTNTIICQIIGNYKKSQFNTSAITAGDNGSIKLNYWVVGDWTEEDLERSFNVNPKTITFKVADTKGPTITVGDMDTVVPYDSEATGDDANRVEIADVTAYDLAGIDMDSFKVTAKYSSSSSEIEIVKYDIANENDAARIAAGFYGYFKATKNGIVTVTYSVSDVNGNAATPATVTIYIGDTSKPEIKASALQDVINKASYKKDSTISLDLSKLVITDNKSVFDKEGNSNFNYANITVTITCTGKDSSEDVEFERSEDNKIIEFKAENFGEYVISFSVKDEAGNVSESSQVSFNLSDNSKSGKNTSTTSSTTVWGTVLIIVILVALGVIIFLFAKPSKTKTTVKTDKKDDNKKDKDDKIQV